MKRLPALLALAVVLRLAFHAVYLPAFEGPDEPHHLARAVAFAGGVPGEAWMAGEVPGAIVSAVRAHPCAPSLQRAYGCPPFGAEPAAFNLLRPGPGAEAARPVRNPESNQPPLFYLAAGLVLRLWRPLPPPEVLLLALRLFAVALVAVALAGPLRALARRRPPEFAVVGLLCLLLPGAAESLARCSNDAAIFLWSALAMAALERKVHGATLALLLAAGPLIKLTAIPVVVFVLVALWQQRRRRDALAGAIAACAVFPLQWLRGWNWGGTVELNRASPSLVEPLGEILLGLARSLYTFLKTTFWLGGWSFFRAPRILVVLFALLLLAWLLAARLRPTGRRLPAHRAAALTAACGFLAFAIANRRLYGVWGGVGGWYLWGWAPWIAVAADDLAALAPRASRALIAATAFFVLAANIAWFAAAARLYG